MKSDLNIEKTEVIQSVLFVNENIDFAKWSQTNELQFEVTPEIGIHSENNHSARLTLDVEVFDIDFMSEAKPFYIKISMHAYFNEETNNNEENIADRFAINMVSLAYPYLRAHITAVCALSGVQNVLLPAINVNKLFEKLSNE